MDGDIERRAPAVLDWRPLSIAPLQRQPLDHRAYPGLLGDKLLVLLLGRRTW